MDIKLIAVDLDGTLLNDESAVSIENLTAIKELNSRGIEVVPCTGRTLGEIPDAVKNNSEIRYVIYSNGAVVLDKKSSTEIKRCIPKDALCKMFERLEKYQVHVSVRTNGNCYIQSASTSDRDITYYNIIPAHEDVIKNYAIEIEDFSPWLNSLEDAEVVSLFFHSEADRQTIIREFSLINEVLCVESFDYNIEVISKDSSKGASLASLSNLLKIDKKNVCAIGDSGNDITMMNSAGVKLATSNANPKLKEICDKIICSNNEHVLDYVKKNF